MTLRKQQEMFPLAIDGKALDYADLLSEALITARNDLSKNTKLTYKIQWEQWRAWCEHYGKEVCPVEPQDMVAHLQWLALRKAQRNTIKLRLRCVSIIDARARMTPEDPTPLTLCQHSGIKRWWKGYVRDQPQKLQNAPYVSREDIALILSRMMDRRVTPTRALHWARDRALILIGYLGAFRRSELATFTVGQVERCSRGIWVRWHRSKGDQEGEGAERLILCQEESELCAVDAWDRWTEMYKRDPLFGGVLEPHLPAFPSLTGTRILSTGLNDEGIYCMVERHSKHAGIPCTPHSLRAGFATHALEENDATEVAFHGRWSSTETMKPYLRRTRAWNKNATARMPRIDRSKR